jgi:hypothetical protein
LFHARKQFTQLLYDRILALPYLEEQELSIINERMGKKHLLGENRSFINIFSHSTLEKMQCYDFDLYETIKDKYEESYASIIDKAGK